MHERECDLLRAAPTMSREACGKLKGAAQCAAPTTGKRKQWRLHAIDRAPVLVRNLYVSGFIDAKLAEVLNNLDATWSA
jgi:hypothetical protein